MGFFGVPQPFCSAPKKCRLALRPKKNSGGLEIIETDGCSELQGPLITLRNPISLYTLYILYTIVNNSINSIHSLFNRYVFKLTVLSLYPNHFQWPGDLGTPEPPHSTGSHDPWQKCWNGTWPRHPLGSSSSPTVKPLAVSQPSKFWLYVISQPIQYIHIKHILYIYIYIPILPSGKLT